MCLQMGTRAFSFGGGSCGVDLSGMLSAGSKTTDTRGSMAVMVGKQHALPPRQFLCITNSGLHSFIKMRPVDQLRQILAYGDSLDVRRHCNIAPSAHGIAS